MVAFYRYWVVQLRCDECFYAVIGKQYWLYAQSFRHLVLHQTAGDDNYLVEDG